MKPDFLRMLYTTETILWEGESSKNAKKADRKRQRTKAFFAVIWLGIGIFIAAAMFCFDYNTSSILVGLIFAGFFVFFGFVFIRSAVEYTHEYYCLTNERLLVAADGEKHIKTYELCEATDAEITAQNGDHGSVLVFTQYITKEQYKRFGGSRQYYGHPGGVWSINGVTGYEELLRYLQSAIDDPVNDFDRYEEKLRIREYADQSYARELQDDSMGFVNENKKFFK